MGPSQVLPHQARQSRRRSNGNEEVLHIPQISSITETSSSDCLISYQYTRCVAGGDPTFRQRNSRCIPQPTGKVRLMSKNPRRNNNNNNNNNINSVDASIQRLEDYIQKHDGGLITAIRTDTDNTMDNRMRITRNKNGKEGNSMDVLND